MKKVSTGRPMTLVERGVIDGAKAWATHLLTFLRSHPGTAVKGTERRLLAAVECLLKSRPRSGPAPRGTAYRDVVKRLDAARVDAKAKLDAKAKMKRSKNVATKRSKKATKKRAPAKRTKG